MRMTERLIRLKDWVQAELCDGRIMKAPGSKMNIKEIVRQEPKCYLAFAPMRMDKTGTVIADELISVVPGILIMPRRGYAKYTEEKRFDRYSNVHRSQDLGQHLVVDILFSIYEPGIRLPGFVDSVGEKGQNLDLSLIEEGTEEGVLTLVNWMDDGMSKLLGASQIPGTDMFVEEQTMQYTLYTDQEYVVDRRPVHYGFVSVSFNCFANEELNNEVLNMLK